MQITIGTFPIDDESAQEAMRKQLILSELKKVRCLIDIFSTQGSGEGLSGGVDDLYASLGRWLSSELCRTTRVLKSGFETSNEIKDY